MNVELRHDAEPTEEGKKRWPPLGYYYGGDLIIDGSYEGSEYHAPCTCKSSCPMTDGLYTDCKGACGCAACWLAEFG